MGFWGFVGSAVLVIGGIITIKIVFDTIIILFKTKELMELDDCPFKFKAKGDDNIIVQLTKDTVLWCEYGLGIRSDGVYGIDKITMLGINGHYGDIRNLKIGQSVFPIIKAMDEFVSWSKQKPFKTEWKDGFHQEWGSMKKNLDNLRVLESELSKKEKKFK